MTPADLARGRGLLDDKACDAIADSVRARQRHETGSGDWRRKQLMRALIRAGYTVVAEREAKLREALTQVIAAWDRDEPEAVEWIEDAIDAARRALAGEKPE